MTDISCSINKVDNAEKIAGEAKYINDIFYEEMLYARTLRSTTSKAKIIEIKKPVMPEGYYIIDYTDIPGRNYVKIIFEDMPVFAQERVNYYGEPILLVVGPDKEVINQLINKIEVVYEEEKPAFDLENSVIHYAFEKGKPKEIYLQAKNKIRYTYKTGYQEHVYIEPQGVIGLYEEGKVTILGSIQCPYYVKNAVMQILDQGEDGVRVKQVTTGGAFGGKEEFPSHIACQVAVAVKKIKKPIKLIYDREEDMEFTTKRHPSVIDFEAYIGENNEIDGLKAHVALDGGAYKGLSGVVLQRAMIASSGAYTINNMSVTGDVYQTNTVPTGAFRGFGAPQMIFAIEMFIHHIAKELKIDPLVLRRKYLAKQGDLTSTSGQFRDPIIMDDMLKKAMEISDYNKKIKAYTREGIFKGIGMSWFLHGCGFTGSGEQKHIKALVRLRKEKDRTVSVLVACVDMGQGIKTTMRKIVANILELPIEHVNYDNPDTDLVPDSGPTVASRTTMIVGGLVARAAKELKERWEEEDVVLVEKRYKQPEYIEWDEDRLIGDAYPAYSWGINVVEVEVNPVTYQVSVVGIWSVYDIGKAIDERIVRGQADGGVLQGIGYGMLEVMSHKEGRMQQKNVTDYIIPTASDCAKMETIIMDNPYPLGPYGAKGVGELTLVGGAPAVALAIETAINRKVTKIPATPEYIMELMKNG
ncbi:xanthine dehydrogenase family protein molybdopterin-binding subunit [Vallitalea okinawensis]|uniref:xanthine dehydrogenase family protein molybdopterin-binding subunit n=1 Tax=Vallitalea okinawensis TaxID=2078660 RepID=UPI002E8E4095|nr:xanthine dehydrogenase family protein molybdopterin-binding subunit [Vallitalea okinawensis]